MSTVKEKKPAPPKDKKPAPKREVKAADKAAKVAATKKTKEDAAAPKSKCKYFSAIQMHSICSNEPPVSSALTITDQISRIFRPTTLPCSLRLRTGRGILMAGPEQIWLAAISPLKFDPSMKIDKVTATRFRLIN